MRSIMCVMVFSFFPETLLASQNQANLGLTDTFWAGLALTLFIAAYLVVVAEEFTHLRKSKPVILAAGAIWVIVALLSQEYGRPIEDLHAALDYNLVEYAELFLFLLVAMTYINAMTERNVFEALRSWLIRQGYSYRKLFWITSIIAFFLSPIADNLTTALLMGAVVLAVGGDNPRFVSLSFINIVVAANAGGAFSPFGDITTLMVWQAGKADFFTFFMLFVPAVVNFLVPAVLMHFAIPDAVPTSNDSTALVPMRRGAKRICTLFLITIATAVGFKQFLHLPPFMGMMTGLSFLLFFSYYLKKTGETHIDGASFNIFNKIERAEWDTLFFFFGVVFCVGGLGYIGYLELTSHLMYDQLGPSTANILAGLLSSIVDNIPVMFAILSMNPDMDTFQWMLVTMTAGVGGSLLSIGSAAGVALMGQSRGAYTFFNHLKWSPAIALGYAASVGAHFLING
ncbi:MAG: sodium:proton antiporter [Proteobacteria bacterium CG1_02_64_396]|nr:MAG: sodium:proton antiporter [Proteobacteria bacterium CG1_02_64_396]